MGTKQVFDELFFFFFNEFYLMLVFCEFFVNVPKNGLY